MTFNKNVVKVLHMVGCLMQRGTFLKTKVLDDLKLGNGEILKIQNRGNRHGCFRRCVWNNFEVGFLYDVEGCEVHPKWPLALAGEFLANALFLRVQK